MEIDPVLLTILGVSAGILILTGWVDQIYKGYKSKSLKDVSKFLLIFISAGAILWLIYGIIVIDVFIIGTNIAAMGHFSELFGRSIMGNARRTKDFTKMVKAFGLSSEDIHYLALDASINLDHINTRMAKMGLTLTNV